MGKEATEPRLIINDLRGGRNGTEPPLSLRDAAGGHGGECVEALNVDWWNASVARKRSGATAFPIGSPLTGVISFLGRHVPGIDETKAQLWMADDAATPTIAVQNLVGTTLTAPSISDPVTGKGWDLQGASFKGKYFLAYQSAQPRLHVFDPATGTIRRAGLTAPGRVTLADSATAGTYPVVYRYYRARVVTISGTIPGTSIPIVTRRSEPGLPLGFAPSGTANGVVVTLVTPPGEGETHWEVEGSADNAVYYVLATQPIATTTYLDTALVSTYGTLPLSVGTGTYNVPRAYRYLAVDNNRLLGFGSFVATDPQSRLEFSAVAGSTNISDEERVPLTNYIDLDDADSGQPTGLIGPVFGSFYVFKYRQVWKLTATGNSAQPYSIYPISKVIGAVHQNAIEMGEDASGNPVVYFMSTRGPYRISMIGLEYLGLPVEDLFQGQTFQINQDSTTVVSHAIYHSAKRQVWFWVATGASNDPNIKIIYDVRRSAWARHDGASARARCSLMFARLIAAASSHDQKPYVGQIDGACRVWRCDDETALDDAGTPYTAYVITKPYPLGGLGAYATVAQGTIIAPASPSTPQLVQRVIGDFGLLFHDAQVSLVPVGSESRVMRLFDASMLGACYVAQFYLGDNAAIANSWAIDAVTVNYVKDQAIV